MLFPGCQPVADVVPLVKTRYTSGCISQLICDRSPSPSCGVILSPGSRHSQNTGPYPNARQGSVGLKADCSLVCALCWCIAPPLQAYKDSGDTASKKGDRIWIAEMYGYSFGAAKTNVWHQWHHDFMLYPSYTPSCESCWQCRRGQQLPAEVFLRLSMAGHCLTGACATLAGVSARRVLCRSCHVLLC